MRTRARHAQQAGDEQGTAYACGDGDDATGDHEGGLARLRAHRPGGADSGHEGVWCGRHAVGGERRVEDPGGEEQAEQAEAAGGRQRQQDRPQRARDTGHQQNATLSESPGEERSQARTQHTAQARQSQSESVLLRRQTELIQHQGGH
ncbi:hypothetical protein ACIHBQ_21460 [Streptomyces sp. NPDC052492]|uniref:hypothetical protein n=1 Tax=Streptomyces sp. NPDC052492 TaxID=3365691 RepID=UPI0037CDAA74